MKLICRLIRWIYLKSKQKKTAGPLKTISKKYSLGTRTGSGQKNRIITKCHLKRIRLRRENLRTSLCVYKIWFGNKYYIGSAKEINARISLHFNSILQCFDGRNIGRNSQTNIMHHLMKNPSITEGIVDILAFVKSEHELVQEEKKWLDSSFRDINCLNYSKNTSRKINGVIVRPK